MSYIIWNTKAGSLGAFAQSQPFAYQLSAVDSNNETLTFNCIAGSMPAGLSVSSSGAITGQPTIQVGAPKEVISLFTIRAANTSGQIADRSFTITVNNFSSIQINPISFPAMFDGEYFAYQFTATVTDNPSPTLSWSIIDGATPLDIGTQKPITINESGLLSGYVSKLIGTTYDASATDKLYTFTLLVTDGITFDSSNIQIRVVARWHITADNTIIKAWDIAIEGLPLTVDIDKTYPPIIITKPTNIPVLSAQDNFAYQFNAIDPMYGQCGPVGWLAQSLPGNMTMSSVSGWISGTLPPQTEDQKTYVFYVQAYTVHPVTREQLKSSFIPVSIIVVKDSANYISWASPTNLGTIVNGTASEFAIQAVSNARKSVVYSALTPLPAGLVLQSNGEIVGRISFEHVSEYDTFTFTVQAQTTDGSVSGTKDFTIVKYNYNPVPYENIWIRALLLKEDRDLFSSIVSNTDTFPPEMIYRSDDPNFGIATTMEMLFIPGMRVSELSTFINNMEFNHYTKALRFGAIKTARALDANFNTRYEVVYIDVVDDKEVNGKSTALSSVQAPYTLYPNSYQNMETRVSNVGYSNRGALPDWMTDRQEDGRELGLVRAIVLAYTMPGTSKLIAYRLNATLAESGTAISDLHFVADRYVLGSGEIDNFDLVSQQYIHDGSVTTDKYLHYQQSGIYK